MHLRFLSVSNKHHHKTCKVLKNMYYIYTRKSAYAFILNIHIISSLPSSICTIDHHHFHRSTKNTKKNKNLQVIMPDGVGEDRLWPRPPARRWCMLSEEAVSNTFLPSCPSYCCRRYRAQQTQRPWVTVKERPPSTLTMSLNDTDRVAPSPNRAAVLPDLVIPGLLDCSPARPLLLQASADLQRNSGDRREKRREQPPVASRDPRGRRCSGAGRRRRRVERVIAGLPSPPGGRIHRQ